MSATLDNLAPAATVQLGAALFILLLLLVLVASFLSRARVFCQYLQHMTGIELSPARVRRVFRVSGRAGVRDLLIDLFIREDLADADRPPVTPDSQPDLPEL